MAGPEERGEAVGDSGNIPILPFGALYPNCFDVSLGTSSTRLDGKCRGSSRARNTFVHVNAQWDGAELPRGPCATHHGEGIPSSQTLSYSDPPCHTIHTGSCIIGVKVCAYPGTPTVVSYGPMASSASTSHHLVGESQLTMSKCRIGTCARPTHSESASRN